MNRRLRLLLKFASQFPGRVILSIVLGFSGALFNGVNTTLLAPILLQLMGQDLQLGSAPPLIQKILSPFNGLEEKTRLILLLVAAITTLALKSLTSYCTTLANTSLRRGLLTRLREVSFDILFAVDIDFYNRHQVGDIVRQVNGEASRTAAAIVNLVRVVNIILSITVFFFILLSISWQLTLISLGLISIVFSVNQIFIHRAKYFGKELTRCSKEFSVQFLETLHGVRLIRSVAMEERERSHMMDLLHAHETMEFKSQMNSAAIGPISEMSSITVMIAIVIIGRFLFENNLESFSALLLIYLVALFRLLPLVSQLDQVRNGLANTSASVELIDDFLRRDNKPFMPQGDRRFMGLQESIIFDNISFHYPQQDRPILQGINLTLTKGKTLALVGSSGSGKSTLIYLMSRFYDPTQGRIILDNQDLRDFHLGSFRRRVGLVSQETFLFNTSVRNNIAYARPDATEAEIQLAAQRAHALEFIEQLPDGWETRVGDRGVMLSGGQRQRIAIARALLQDPDILLLDEATSALDTVSERLVQQALDELSRDRTVMVVAHRLSTVRHADTIVVMDQGQVVEQGTHGELLQRRGKYAQLWEMQFGSPDDCPTADPVIPDVWVNPALSSRSSLGQVLDTLNLLVTGLEEEIPLEEEAAESFDHLQLAQEAYGAAQGLLQGVQRSETQIAEFGQLSYQIRTYLNAMIGSLQLVVDGMTDSPQEDRELIQEAHQAGTGLLELLQSSPLGPVSLRPSSTLEDGERSPGDSASVPQDSPGAIPETMGVGEPIP